MDMVASVCEIPVRFYVRGDVSLLRLVDESGYRDSPEALTVNAVSAYLAHHPDLVEAWLGYSSDKRGSSGWYFVEKSPVKFEVGCHPNGPQLAFDDRDRACAEFIIHEVRSIAG